MDRESNTTPLNFITSYRDIPTVTLFTKRLSKKLEFSRIFKIPILLADCRTINVGSGSDFVEVRLT